MEEKASLKQRPLAGVLSVQDEKIGKVVEEVDRFFRSVHANIEDWKFAMQEDEDGTRIFVRFQIHIRVPGSPSRSRTSSHRATGVTGISIGHDGGDAADRTEISCDSEPANPAAPTAEADPDLAAFVREWQRRRRDAIRTEFHEKGAPLLDGRPERPVARRRRRSPRT
jgi:hypothetical protein